LHVGLNLVYLVPGETGGMEVYARELIPRLADQNPGVRFTAFISREAAERDGEQPWGDAVRSVTVPVRATNRVEWVRGEQQHLPRLAAREGVDVMHSLASTAPVWGRFARVVTIHDLIYRVHPEAHFGVRTLGMRLLVPLSARRSHRIVAVSNATKRDLVKLLGTAPDKIDVVPNGVGLTGLPEPSAEGEIRSRFGLGDRPVVLSASARRPHKNLARLLDAMALIPAQRRPMLVLPGYPTPYERELRDHATALGLDRDVRFLGWVDASDMEGLYRASSCFVFPSLYEGFGLPVLEAMSRGVPVACSDGGSLGEVAGGAALVFDPMDPGSIARSVERILTDEPLAGRLRTAGRERAQAFGWDATAEGTFAAYERALERFGAGSSSA
jgi:glycosyltransferase involved in cell wall biosynthesis